MNSVLGGFTDIRFSGDCLSENSKSIRLKTLWSGCHFSSFSSESSMYVKHCFQLAFESEPPEVMPESTLANHEEFHCCKLHYDEMWMLLCSR